MIKLLDKSQYSIITDYLKRDAITNYFIITSLERLPEENMFEKIWVESTREGGIAAVLCKRKTGNMQFYSDSKFDIKKFCEILNKEDFNKLIGHEAIIESFVQYFNFSKKVEGSYISKLDCNTKVVIYKEDINIEIMKLQDIDRIIELYKEVFNGFATKKSMIRKLEEGTGRGCYIKQDDIIVCAAQTSYENDNSAIIIGVATHPQYRRKGYASKCLSKLCRELVKEGKDLYLQYDNIEAGKIYNKLGFVDIGRMASYYK
jgi:predicted GNAT family acetyltransferase